MEERLIEKLSFLSRVSMIDKNLEKDFDLIINFVNKISNFDLNSQNVGDSRLSILRLEELRNDIIKENLDVKVIHKNFSNKEDEFCVVPLIIEKEKTENGEADDY